MFSLILCSIDSLLRKYSLHVQFVELHVTNTAK